MATCRFPISRGWELISITKESRPICVSPACSSRQTNGIPRNLVSGSRIAGGIDSKGVVGASPGFVWRCPNRLFQNLLCQRKAVILRVIADDLTSVGDVQLFVAIVRDAVE